MYGVVCVKFTDGLRVDKLGNTVHLKAVRAQRIGLRLSPVRIVTNLNETDISRPHHSSSAVQFLNDPVLDHQCVINVPPNTHESLINNSTCRLSPERNYCLK
jgi:hypothetical protein